MTLTSPTRCTYPHTLLPLTDFVNQVAQIFVVNAPAIFNALFNVIRPFLNEDTLTKISFSSQLPDDLVPCIGAACLPSQLNGHRQNVFPYCADFPPCDLPYVGAAYGLVERFYKQEEFFEFDTSKNSVFELTTNVGSDHQCCQVSDRDSSRKSDPLPRKTNSKCDKEKWCSPCCRIA